MTRFLVVRAERSSVFGTGRWLVPSASIFFFFRWCELAVIHKTFHLIMGKEKKEKKVKQVAGSDNEEETRVLEASPIAHPMAEKKLTKKLLKTVKKG